MTKCRFQGCRKTLTLEEVDGQDGLCQPHVKEVYAEEISYCDDKF